MTDRPNLTPDALTVELTRPAIVRTMLWQADKDDGSTFTPGHWADSEVSRVLTPGRHSFAVVAGQSVSFTFE